MRWGEVRLGGVRGDGVRWGEVRNYFPIPQSPNMASLLHSAIRPDYPPESLLI